MTSSPTSSVTLDLNGYTGLPPGKLASIVTHLEMTALPDMTAPDAKGLELVAVTAPDPDWYRQLFRRIGESWLWFSRLKMDRAELAAILADPGVAVHVLRHAGQDVGLMELDLRTQGEVELAYLGVVPELLGHGAGRFMMHRALTLAFAQKPKRVHVHTCTLDHHAALAFYQRSGFVAVARSIEIVDDPRLTGLLARDAAPHVPLIEND